MPNWTKCTLEVYGNEDQVNDFIKKAVYTHQDGETAPIACEAFVPCPQELTDTMAGSYGIDDPKQKELEAKEKANLAKYGHKNWYDWKKENWGVKWGLCDATITEQGAGYITYEFNTPWCAPQAWLAKVAKMYPRVCFDLGYVLEGYEGCGRYIYENGELDHEN